MKNLVLFSFIDLMVFFFTLSYVNGRCGINLLKKPKRILIQQEYESIRSLKGESWEPLRIHLDYSKIDNNVGKFDKNDIRDLKERIMPKTIEVLQNLLKVKRVPKRLKLPEGSMCDDIVVPERYITEGVEADLIIFVQIDETGLFIENKIEAAAIHCLQDQTSSRPVTGYIQFKPRLQVSNSTAADYMIWLALHEITHILVFNDALYPDWLDENFNNRGLQNVVGSEIIKSGKKMYYIKSPKILEKGKEHYNCPNFKGLPLEYNGGPGTAGAHWAKRFMNTDYMIGDSYGENLISDLSLAMFEDSGWYKPNYELSNLFLWGRDKGCFFFDMNKKCVEQKGSEVVTNFKDEFCTKLNYPICSPSNIFRANCRGKIYNMLFPHERYFTDPKIAGTDSLIDKCPIPIEVKRGQNYYGGSCRVGKDGWAQPFERICPECACFLSNLREKESEKKRMRKRIIPQWEDMNIDINDNIDNFKDYPDNHRIILSDSKISNYSTYNNTIVTKETARVINNSTDNKGYFKTSFIKQNYMPLPKLTENDLSAQCLEYKCEANKLFVMVKGNKYQCLEGTPLYVDGYSGYVQCPSASIICHPKFNCKFGCLEKYSNTNEFKAFLK